MIIDCKIKSYRRGDSYFIAAKTIHSAKIHSGFKAIYYFEDKDKYKTL
jgi:hypothetical protein